jgi:hypothetical protein
MYPIVLFDLTIRDGCPVSFFYRDVQEIQSILFLACHSHESGNPGSFSDASGFPFTRE